jgi:hypothetical protein
LETLEKSAHRVNWPQWVATVLPLMVTITLGAISLYRAIETRVLIQEQQLAHVVREVEDHRSRLANLENTANRNDERLRMVLESAQGTQEEIKGLRRDVAVVAAGVRAVRRGE